jgi:YD repeat-containing protein
VRPGYETNSTYAVSSSTAYNIAGSPVSTTDPLNRSTTINYADNFNSSGNPTTYAYPTTVTDPGGKSSTIQYRFDIGANVWARSPTPYNDSIANTYGKTTSRTYDDATGRITKEKIENPVSGAYTRYEYANTGNATTTYSTIIHEGTGSPGSSDEVATLTEYDGAGRIRRSRTDNPDSSTVYTAKQLQYDILGRVTGETVPTLVSSSWQPTGDDYRGGNWLWNLKEYDWKGRVLRSIPSDSTSSDHDKDTVFTYDGCGCAGGQETTISGPKADAIDMNGGTTITTGQRKTQKIIEDVLGRPVTKEIRSLNGTNLYSTITTTYNGRDQVTQITESAGTNSQSTTMSYDGHGRLSMVHKPEWYGTSPTDPKYTTTEYNPDDTVWRVTDPRGARTTYTYETNGTLQRPLVTGIAYETPNPNPTPHPIDGDPLFVPPTASVTFVYDDAGNRKQMTDGTGTLYYNYDELSRLKNERKVFADMPNNGYTTTYEYHLNGSLKSITDPLQNVTTYSADKAGRVTDIGTGSDADYYASGISYRSFGAVKEMYLSTTNQTHVQMTYDDALRPATYEAENSTTGAGWIQKASYTYHKDGALKTITNTAHSGFSQTNDYDFAGRLKKNDVGSSGGTFTQTLGYDAFSNLTDRTSQTYSLSQIGFSATYSNNRKSGDGYDKAGNVISVTTSGQEAPSGGAWHADVKNWYYDAAGRQSRWEEFGPWGTSTKKGVQTTYDGDGHPAKRTDLNQSYIGYVWGEWGAYNNWYYIYSSVTGQKIADFCPSGLYNGGHSVYMGGTVIWDDTYQGPKQDDLADDYYAIGFKVTDPISGSTQEMNSDGSVPTGTPDARNELAGLGTSVPAAAPTPYPPNYYRGAYAGGSEDCQIDYAPVPCRTMMGYLQSRWALFAGHLVVWQQEFLLKRVPSENPKNPSFEVKRMWWESKGEIDVPGRGSKSFEDFFGAYPRCYFVFQRVFGKEFKNFLASLHKLKFVDVRKSPSLLDKTLKELKIPSIEDDGSTKELPGTLRDVESYSNAVTSIDTNKVYLFGSFFTNYSSLEQEGVKIHEHFHKYLRANHTNILRTLGIDLPSPRLLLAGTPGWSIGGITMPPIPPVYSTVESESGSALTPWLNNGCKAP